MIIDVIYISSNYCLPYISFAKTIMSNWSESDDRLTIIERPSSYHRKLRFKCGVNVKSVNCDVEKTNLDWNLLFLKEF